MPCVEDLEQFRVAMSMSIAGEVLLLAAAPLAWLGGAVFERGLLRVHTVDFAGIADAYVVAGLPEFAGTIPCFAFDWLGREFSLDSPESSGTIQASRCSSPEPLRRWDDPVTRRSCHILASGRQ